MYIVDKLLRLINTSAVSDRISISYEIFDLSWTVKKRNAFYGSQNMRSATGLKRPRATVLMVMYNSSSTRTLPKYVIKYTFNCYPDSFVYTFFCLQFTLYL